MDMTTKQTAQKLGIPRQQLLKLVKAGKIATINKAEGRRVAHLFDPRVVREFKRTYTPTPRGVSKTKSDTAPAYGLLTGLAGTLQRIEEKLEKLEKAWS